MAGVTHHVHTDPNDKLRVSVRDFGDMVVVEVTYGFVTTKFFLPNREAMATLFATLGAAEVVEVVTTK